MSKKVIISCDSTVDLTPDLIEKYQIVINPMPVVLGDKTLRDGIEVKPADLFEYTKSTGKLATTSAPNTEDYTQLFTRLVSDGNEVIHFPISSSLSGSYNFARIAASEIDGVYVIDSQNLSTGIALLALKAAEMAQDGADAQSIVAEIEKIIPYVDASFVIDNLEFLHKGGRCSSVAMLGANVLKLKPCIEVTNGAMGVGKKYRGKYSDVLLTYAKERLAEIDDIDTSRIFVTHTCQDEATAQAVYDLVKATGKFDEVLFTTAGCTVSAHCGPDTLGLLYIRKTPKA
ncbi:MAG: DegV family protein [Clostridia bacterium]|nr:DegV family protein [Clostridia bacterium]